MLRKPSFWVPLAVVIVLATVLGCLVDDRFGTNLAAYVGSVSTLVLIAVTISYVLATYALAKSAEEQVNIARNARAVETTVATWDAFNDVRDQIKACEWYLHTISSSDQIDLDHWRKAESRRSQERITLLQRFLDDYKRREILLPRGVQATGQAVWEEIYDLVDLEATLSNAIRAQLERPGYEAGAFDWQLVVDEFEHQRHPFPYSDRSWDGLASRSDHTRLNSRLSAFRAAVVAVVQAT